MEYSILTCTDGNNIVRAEHIKGKDTAFKTFHHWCELLFNDNSFTKGMVKLLDENLDCVEGKMEFIQHEIVQQTPPAETPAEPPAESAEE